MRVQMHIESLLCQLRKRLCAWWYRGAYQLYSQPLTLTSFHRFSRLVEALGRGLLYVLVSLYFDDARITDWASSRQPMGKQEGFLGLEHDFSAAFRSGVVFFLDQIQIGARTPIHHGHIASGWPASTRTSLQTIWACEFL